MITRIAVSLFLVMLSATSASAQPAPPDHGSGTNAECQRYGCLYGHRDDHYDRTGEDEIEYGIAHERLPDGPDGRFFVQVMWPEGYNPARRGAWDRVAECESTWRWHIDSTYDGGLQFSPGTWRAYGGTMYAGYAYAATPEQQIAIAENVLREGYGPHGPQGRGAWPHCARHM